MNFGPASAGRTLCTKSIYLDGSIHGRRTPRHYSTEVKEGKKGCGDYFDSAGGCWITRTPAMRAGLKDRSQSAYAAPAPKPDERAMGHARPDTSFEKKSCHGGMSRTAKEDDGCDDTDTEADTPVRGTKSVMEKEAARLKNRRRTILLVNPPLTNA
jgi:hypothetical protein